MSYYYASATMLTDFQQQNFLMNIFVQTEKYDNDPTRAVQVLHNILILLQSCIPELHTCAIIQLIEQNKCLNCVI